jgi:hypothetical protein
MNCLLVSIIGKMVKCNCYAGEVLQVLKSCIISRKDQCREENRVSVTIDEGELDRASLFDCAGR